MVQPIRLGTRRRDWVQNVSDIPGLGLTPRQAAALVELAVHGSYATAAECMGLKEQTVKNHVSSILIRLGARSAIQAIWLLGWFVPPPDLRHI